MNNKKWMVVIYVCYTTPFYVLSRDTSNKFFTDLKVTKSCRGHILEVVAGEGDLSVPV